MPFLGIQNSSKNDNFSISFSHLKVRAEVNQQDTKRVSPLHTAVHQVGCHLGKSTKNPRFFLLFFGRRNNEIWSECQIHNFRFLEAFVVAIKTSQGFSNVSYGEKRIIDKHLTLPEVVFSAWASTEKKIKRQSLGGLRPNGAVAPDAQCQCQCSRSGAAPGVDKSSVPIQSDETKPLSNQPLFGRFVRE